MYIKKYFFSFYFFRIFWWSSCILNILYLYRQINILKVMFWTPLSQVNIFFMPEQFTYINKVNCTSNVFSFLFPITTLHVYIKFKYYHSINIQLPSCVALIHPSSVGIYSIFLSHSMQIPSVLLKTRYLID